MNIVGDAFFRQTSDGNGYITLTEAQTNQQGSVYFDRRGWAAHTFDASMFVSLKDGSTSDSVNTGDADGISFGYAPLSGAAFGEQGEVSRGGLWVSIATYPPVAGIRVYYAGAQIASYSASSAALRGNWNPLNISVSPNGTLSLSYPAIGTRTVSIPNWNPGSNWQFGVGARTGASTDWHVLEHMTVDANSRPSVVLPNYSVAEGSTVTLTASGSDPNGDGLTYSWDLDNDGAFDDATGKSVTFSAALLDGPATRTVRVAAYDGQFSAVDSGTITVLNAAPTISSVTTSSPIREGLPTTISVSASDPAGSRDALTYEFDFDNNGTYEVTNTTGSATYSFPDNGAYTFNVRVTDDDGASDVESTTVIVQNVAPSISSVTSSGLGTENSPVTIQVVASDPAGTRDPLTYRFDFDNDGVYEYLSSAGSATHLFADNGTYQVNVRVDDADGGVTTSFTHVVVNNVAPVITGIENTGPVPQGTPVAITVTAVDQAAANDPLTWLFDLDDDGVFEVSNATGRVAHVFFNAGTHRVGIGVQDDDGGLSTSYTDVTVLSITPPPEAPGDLPRVAFDTGYRSVLEDAGTLHVTARLSKPSDTDVVIPLAVSGTATASDDYLSTTSITIPAGQLTASSPLVVVNDSEAETSESIVIRMLPPTNAVLSSYPADPIVQTIILQANDAPEINLTVAYQEVPESHGDVTLVARLSNAASEVVVAPFSVTGTAAADIDYSLSAHAFVFQPGQLESSIVLTVKNDEPALFEPHEEVSIKIVSPRIEHADGTSSLVLPGTTTSSTVVIQDDDQPQLSFSLASSVYEDAGAIPITAQLSTPSSTDTVVTFQVRADSARLTSDYALSNGSDRQTVVIPAGSLSATSYLSIINDTVSESRERLIVYASAVGVVNPRYASYLSINDDDVQVRILDGTTKETRSTTYTSPSGGLFPGMTFTLPPSPQPIGEGGTRDVTFRIELTSPTNKPVTVPVYLSGTARSDLDYDLLSDLLVTIPAGQTAGTVNLRIRDDAISESTETIIATLGAPVNATLDTQKSSLNLNVEDNDALPTLTFTTSSQTVAEDVGYVFVTVSMSNVSGNSVYFDVGWRKSGAAPALIGEDYAFQESRVMIPAGKTEATFAVQVIDDALVEGSESFGVGLTRVWGAAVQGLFGQWHTVTISDNDKKPATTKYRPSAEHVGALGQLQILVPESDASASQPGPTSTGTKSTSGSNKNTSYINPGALHIMNANSSQLSGGTLFFDGNRNLTLDPGEYQVTTELDGSALTSVPAEYDLNGDGVIDASEGQWVMAGSVDPSTGLAFSGTLTAPVGSWVVSPLTTLMTGLVEHQLAAFQDIDLAAASLRVTEALGLPAIPLMQFDATVEANAGNMEAAAIYAAQAMVYDTVRQIAALAAGLDGAPPRNILETIVFRDMTTKIREAGSGLNLANRQLVRSIIDGTLQATGLSGSEELLSGAATVIAAGNAKIASIPLAGERAYLEAVARVKKLAQGEIATSLMLASVGQLSINTVVSSYTGSVLDQLVSSTPIGNVIAPELWIGDVRIVEGDEGFTWAEFRVLLVNDTVVPVSVQFTSIDSSATVADSDYTAVSGMLTWNPGDEALQTIRVAVNADGTFETDEAFLLLLENPENAVIRRHLGTAIIENDDAVDLDVAADGNDSEFQIYLSGTDVVISRNGDVLMGGSIAAAPITIRGPAGVANVFRIHVGEGSHLPAGGLHIVGDGDDHIEITQDALADRVEYRLEAPVAGSIHIDGRSVTFTGVSEVHDDVAAFHRLFDFAGSGAQHVSLGDDADVESFSSRLRNDEGGQTWTVDFTNPWHTLAVQTGAGADQVGIDAMDAYFDAAVSINTGNDNDVITLRATSGSGEYSVDGGLGNDAFHHLGGQLTSGKNVAATVFSGEDGQTEEGAAFLRSGYFTDPGHDAWTATVNYGDGSGTQPLSLTEWKTFQLNHVYADNGVYTVTVTIRDDQGDVDVDVFQVVVTNVTPTVDFVGSSLNLDASAQPIAFSGVRGQTLYFDGSLIDPGFDNSAQPGGATRETFTYTIHWGDGSSESGTADRVPGSDNVLTTGSFRGSHIYQAAGQYTVTITVTDDDGGTTVLTRLVTVAVASLQQNGDLAVGGTDGHDNIRLSPSGSKGDIAVTLNDVLVGLYRPTGRLLVMGQAGDDDLQVAGSIGLSAWLYGDAGNDRLKGGAGSDLLLGGDGDDLLVGGNGADVLIGGLGADRILGNADDDLMVAGSTIYDYRSNGLLHRSHGSAFESLLSVWSNDSLTLAQRIALLSGAADAELPYRLNSSTVSRDGAQDVLTGSSGSDWFILGDEEDRATDAKALDEIFRDALDFILSE